MSKEADAAYAVFEEATRRIMELVLGTFYGLRVGAKRLGDLTAKGGPLPSLMKKSSDEMREIIAALAHADENVSEAAIILLGSHFSAFLQGAFAMEKRPSLPGTPEEIERLAGLPGALAKTPREFRIFLALHDSMLSGAGVLNRTALERLGMRELELVHSGGKVKMYMEGERVTLSEEWIADALKGALEAARAIRLRLAAPGATVLH